MPTNGIPITSTATRLGRSDHSPPVTVALVAVGVVGWDHDGGGDMVAFLFRYRRCRNAAYKLFASLVEYQLLELSSFPLYERYSFIRNTSPETGFFLE